MSAFRYYVVEYHHGGGFMREFLNVGVLVVDPRSDNIRGARTISDNSQQWNRVQQVGDISLDTIADWTRQFVDLDADEIEAFRGRSYASSLLLSEPYAVLASDVTGALDQIFGRFCGPILTSEESA